ncbi:MAG TPA: hypothetical protein ENJ95_24300 [Bacteroidetes bacterium]|nr:hypothetical protein [Bacteroidota bacterium]
MKPFLHPFLTLLFAGIAAAPLPAQETHIYYNLHNDEVKYKKEGKTLARPAIKQGDEIVLHLTEFNNYLYRVELEINQENFTQKSAVGTDASLMSGLMPGLPTPGFSGLLGDGGDSTDGGGLGLLNIPLLSLNGNPISLSSIFGGSRGSAQMLEQLAATTAEISSLVVEIDGITSQVKDLRKTAFASQMAMGYMEVLKTHPNLKPSFVKNMCKDYYGAIFRKNPDEDFALNDILKLQDDALKYNHLLAQLQTLNSTLSKKTGMLDALSRQFKGMELDDADYLKYASSLTGFLKKSKALNLQMEAALKDSPSLGKYTSATELANLQLKLVEIIDNDFTHHSRFQVTDDQIGITIKVLKKEEEINGEPEIMKTRQLHYIAKGGLKITGSVGLNFSQYFEPAQSYSVSKGLIVGEDEGAFTPTVTSFIHFYTYSGKKTSLGGSFGIGFPLTGTGDSQSLQFFAGPSLIFGSSQRIVLNAGLTGGRVARLARGFQVGDEFDVTVGDIPTKSPYELGVYVGASFNLGGN